MIEKLILNATTVVVAQNDVQSCANIDESNEGRLYHLWLLWPGGRGTPLVSASISVRMFTSRSGRLMIGYVDICPSPLCVAVQIGRQLADFSW